MRNITKLNHDHYEIRISYKCALTGKRRRLKRRVEGSLDDAVKLRDRLRVQAADGDIEAPNSACEKSLEGYLEDYLTHRDRRDGLASSTLQNERYGLGAILDDEVGSWRPEGIKAVHIDRLVSTWLNTPKDDGTLYSPTTVKNRLGLLTRYLSWVFKRRGLDASPLSQIEGVKARKKVKRKGRALSKGEAKAFLQGIKEGYPQHYALVFTLLMTGQRIGSVSALRWEDIDQETITFATSHYRGEVRQGNKTGKTVRLPMTPDIWEVLQEHRKTMVKDQHPGLSSGLIFPTEKGGYRVSGDLRYSFNSVCEAKGLDSITPHDLRRTFNSWSVEAGVSGTILRSITAHSSSDMTDHYYHGSKDAKAGVMELVSSALNG